MGADARGRARADSRGDPSRRRHPRPLDPHPCGPARLRRAAYGHRAGRREPGLRDPRRDADDPRRRLRRDPGPQHLHGKRRRAGRDGAARLPAGGSARPGGHSGLLRTLELAGTLFATLSAQRGRYGTVLGTTAHEFRGAEDFKHMPAIWVGPLDQASLDAACPKTGEIQTQLDAVAAAVRRSGAYRTPQADRHRDSRADGSLGESPNIRQFQIGAIDPQRWNSRAYRSIRHEPPRPVPSPAAGRRLRLRL